MKIFVTKWALTLGVQCWEAELEPEGTYFHTRVGGFAEYFRKGVDAFDNRQDAIEKAESMQRKKIISLSKSIKKLQSLTFSTGEVGSKS